MKSVKVWMSLLLTSSLILFTSAANAAEVAVNGVGMVDPWDGAKGAVTVDYSLAGLETDVKYKVVFDITANGRTASVTNDAAMLSDGRQPVQTIDTAQLFRGAVADKDATLTVSLISVRRVPGVQLWKDGPYWAESNIGESGVQGHPEYGKLYTFGETGPAVASLLGSFWRVPSKDDLDKLINESVCTQAWDDTRKGWLFTGKGDYASNSIFLPAAGYGIGSGRSFAGYYGYYWSSTSAGDSKNAWHLLSSHIGASVYTLDCTYSLSVRPVRNIDSPMWEDVAKAEMEVNFPLGVTAVALPTGLTGYGYVVSNLTAHAEVEKAGGGGVDGATYVLPLGAKIGVYAVPETGYAIVGTNPYVIENVTLQTVVDASRLAKVSPTVKLNGIKSVSSWNDGKGPVAVDYTLAGLDADRAYKVAFEITANGRTASVTNAVATLSDGRQPIQTNDTVRLFGEMLVADDAEMKLSLVSRTASGGSERGEVVESVAEARFLLGLTEVTLPMGMTGYGYVVSNLTDVATVIEPSVGGRYVLPLGAKVGVYVKADEGYAIVGTNPYVIEEVVGDAPMDRDRLPKVAPKVMALKAETVDPWNGVKGAVAVDYLLAGLDARTEYKVAFHMTAGGWSATVTNDVAKATDGATNAVINTVELFGRQVVDIKAKVKISLISVCDAEIVQESAEVEFRLGPGGESCPWTVTVGEHPHMSVSWTSGDGAETNELTGTAFRVVDGTENVKIVFTADDGWVIEGDGVVSLGMVTDNVAFGNESGYQVPKVGFLYSYLDYDESTGTFTNALRTGTLVESTMEVLESGWYVVADEIAIPSGKNIRIDGDVHLILCDGASLTVADPGEHAAGIAVVDAHRLTVYGQEAGTGVLTAQGGQFSAGIGGYTAGYGAYEPDCGTVTINGGTVVATGGESASGIGCSPMGLGGHVVIHGGMVTAKGGVGGGGIGSNRNSGLAPKADSEVVITGGKVSAMGYYVTDIHWANVSISGGVFVRRPEAGWCADHFGVFANPDSETRADYPYAVLPTCTVTVGVCPAHVSAAWTSGDGTKTNALAGTSFVVLNGTENVTVIFMAEADWGLVGDAVVELDSVTDDIVFGAGSDYRVPEARYLLGDIPYRDWDGTRMVDAAKPKYVFTFVTDETREFRTGWYAVTNDVVFPEGANLTVTGDAHLILCDGASLTITNVSRDAAIDVSRACLTICGQSEGTGRLTATGGQWGAGIGGGMERSGGAVTINGGMVTAQGGDDGAGIGGGQKGAGGSVTIRGGAVSVKGGVHAEDIGRGVGLQDSGAVFVSGGIFARKPQDGWLESDCALIANQDAITEAEYPWAVVPYPATWPAADHAVMAKFGEWRNGKGAEADLAAEDAQKAFLLNVAVAGIRELRIESLDVDAEGSATVVVSAPGMYFFDRVDLGAINGVLSVLAGDTLETMTPKAVTYWTTTNGKANIRVKANFIRAVIGFQAPEVSADTLLPPEQE